MTFSFGDMFVKYSVAERAFWVHKDEEIDEGQYFNGNCYTWNFFFGWGE